MKTIRTYWRKYLVLALAFALALPLLVSCGREEAPHTTRVVTSTGFGKVGEYGQYIYSGSKVTWRYDRKTGEIRRACLDPECDGNCPLEGGYAHVTQIADGKMYFCTWFYHGSMDENLDWPTVYGFQDLSTGEITVLAEVPFEDSDEGTAVFVYDGMMYYTRYTLKEGLDPNEARGESNKEFHDHWLCRVPITGGEEERLRRTEGIVTDMGRQDELYFMIADGYFLTCTADGKILSYDRDFKESTVFLDMTALGYSFAHQQYLDGTVYLLLYDGTDPATRSHPYLASIDLATKEIRRLTDMSVYGFAVTEDAIYYEPYLGSTLYIPENNEKQSDLAPDERDWDRIINVSNGRTVHACALDGSGDRIVFTSEYEQFLQNFTVIDGVLYAWLYGEESLAEPAKFCAVDLASGTVTPAKRIDA